MLSLVLTVLVLLAVYFVQQTHPFLAGILAVAPVKIIGTSFIAYEEGGISELHEAMTGMLFAQVAVAVVLLVAWLALR
jgi:uncharacterized membrane protein (GlpM family)